MSENKSDLNFETVKIGDSLGPEEFHLSKDQVRSYAKATGMWVPRFTDDEAARKEGLPGMITPGNMSLAILSKLVTDWIGASGAQLTRMGTTPTRRKPITPPRWISGSRTRTASASSSVPQPSTSPANPPALGDRSR